MQPLYAAVVHGCRAGRVQEAMDEVYGRRILRGNEHFSWSKLGAFGSELTALAGFFDPPWSRPSPSLRTDTQALVLALAGFHLRALGRLAEAVEPMQASWRMDEERGEWKGAAESAGPLSELTLTLGAVARAVKFAEQSIELADRSGDAFQKILRRANWADALHQAGRWEESAATFREAETMQAEWQAQYPRLYSLRGYWYCDLLLGRLEPEDGSGLGDLAAGPEAAKHFREVLERASQTLAWVQAAKVDILSIALDHLTLGRAHLGLAQTAPEDRDSHRTQAAEALNHAVDGLRKSANEDDIPRGLLARAAFHRLGKDFPAATEDLAEALEIAERGGMRLHECDVHLELARLCRDQENLLDARKHAKRARELVNQTGYKRREREVAYLERTLTP
jgi:tetratricopeptide (TPR) repeat protein